MSRSALQARTGLKLDMECITHITHLLVSISYLLFPWMR